MGFMVMGLVGSSRVWVSLATHVNELEVRAWQQAARPGRVWPGRASMRCGPSSPTPRRRATRAARHETERSWGLLRGLLTGRHALHGMQTAANLPTEHVVNEVRLPERNEAGDGVAHAVHQQREIKEIRRLQRTHASQGPHVSVWPRHEGSPRRCAGTGLCGEPLPSNQHCVGWWVASTRRHRPRTLMTSTARWNWPDVAGTVWSPEHSGGTRACRDTVCSRHPSGSAMWKGVRRRRSRGRVAADRPLDRKSVV